LVVLPEQRTPSIEAFRLDLGLSAQGQRSAQLPVTRNDPNATVIRPPPSIATAPAGGISFREVHRPGPGGPDMGALAMGRMAAAALPSNTMGGTQAIGAMPAPQPRGIEERPFGRGPQAVEAQARQASETRLVDGVGHVKSGRLPIILTTSAVAAALAAAAIGWMLMKPDPEQAPRAADAASTLALPAAKQGPSEAPGVAAPVSVEAAARQPATLPETKLSQPAAIDRAMPATTVTSRSSQLATQRLPAQMAKPAAPSAAGEGQPEQKAAHASPRVEERRPERRQADSATGDECGRIVHQLSLGESSPELIERLKALKCR
jgi:hypothetical protein